MATLRHVREFFLKGYCKLPLIRSIDCMQVINSQRTVCLNSCTRYDAKIISDSRKPVWTSMTLNVPSPFLLHLKNSSTYSSRAPRSAENKTSAQENSDTKHDSETPSYTNQFNPDLVEELLKGMQGDMPVPRMQDPFEKDYRRCFICKYNIKPDHKNVRLLSQFVSPYTGRIYGRAITGLCIPMQKRIAQLIKRARMSGFMPIMLKDPRFLKDPLPYDAMSKKH